MTNLIVAQNNSERQAFPFYQGKRRPYKRDGRGPQHAVDPYRRLIAAVALRAAADVMTPPKRLNAIDRWTAHLFVQQCAGVYLALDIPPAKIAALQTYIGGQP